MIVLFVLNFDYLIMVVMRIEIEILSKEERG